MTDFPPDGVETPPEVPESESQQPEGPVPPVAQQDKTDWRVLVIIGVAILLLLAAFINRKFYGKKQVDIPLPDSIPTAQEQEAAQSQQPALPPAEQYQRLLMQYRAELLGTLFDVDGKPMLLARPPLVAPLEEARQGTVPHEPGVMYDLSNRIPALNPQDFQRRGFFNMPGMAYMDSFQPLGGEGAPKLVIKPSTEVSLDVVADNHVVIGVVSGDEARAYPLRLANHHEVINDTLGGRPIVVAWSALGLTAQAFDRTVGETQRQFGSAGLMHQGVIVLVDRETRSLWSPSRHLCLAGPSAGASLELLPTYITTWKEWRRIHPDSSALVGTDPVLNIKYDTNPAVPPNYYGPNPAVLHPVAGIDVLTPHMPLKARVFGIALADGRAKAYAMVLLEELKEPAQDSIGDTNILLTYNADANILTATTADGAALPVETMFWMVWHGAHPETDIWQDERLQEMMNPVEAAPVADTMAVQAADTETIH